MSGNVANCLEIAGHCVYDDNDDDVDNDNDDEESKGMAL